MDHPQEVTRFQSLHRDQPLSVIASHSSHLVKRHTVVADHVAGEQGMQQNLSSTAMWNMTSNTGIPPAQWANLGLLPVIAFTMIGNFLVCIAILRTKKLRTSNNYFLMSMSIADLMVAILVMPLSVAVEINEGQFPLTATWCNIWVGLDILCCSSSIWHMCIMSMDRFLTLRFPLRYGRNKSLKSVTLKVIVVWATSLIISMPLTILGFSQEENVFKDGLCAPRNDDFIFYGSIFAFYVPLVLMAISYSMTMRTLRAVMQNKEQGFGRVPRLAVTASRPFSSSGSSAKQAVTVTTSSTGSEPMFGRRKTVAVLTEAEGHRHLLDTVEHRPKWTIRAVSLQPDSIAAGHAAFLSKLPPPPFCHRSSTSTDEPSEGESVVLSVPHTSESRQRGARRRVNTERKALRVLLIIFIVFVILWSPFFIYNIICVLCKDNCNFANSREIGSAVVWLGYISSLANPIIYTMFSKTFRSAFIQIVCGSRGRTIEKRHNSHPLRRGKKKNHMNHIPSDIALYRCSSQAK